MAKSLFYQKTHEDRRRDEDGPRGAHATWRRPPLGRAVAWCGRLGHPLAPPFLLLKALDVKTPCGSTFFHEEFRSSAATKNPNSGTRNSVLAPCRDGELEEIIAIIITAYKSAKGPQTGAVKLADGLKIVAIYRDYSFS